MDELIEDNVRVSWVELGEGICGDYYPDDPDDYEHLRFDVDVLVDGEWECVDDASYCTTLPVSLTPDERALGLKVLMGEFYEPVMDGHSVKKLGERMSWIGLSDVQRMKEKGY